jgi:small-conductance mechanosensitive channel
MSRILQELDRVFAELAPQLPHLLEKAALSLALLLLLGLLRVATIRFVSRHTDDVGALYRWRKISLYLAVVSSLLLLGVIWLQQFRSVIAVLGLLSAGLAIALSGFVASIAGWAFILLRRPFEVGDRIQVGPYAGDVIDLRLFKFTLMEIGNWVHADQSTGRVIHVPNSLVISEAVINYTRDFQYIWNEIPVLVTFESHWEAAKRILQEIADRHAVQVVEEAQASLRRAARRFMIYYSHLTPTVYTSVEDSGVLLTIRHLCEPRRRRGANQAIWEDILRAFASAPDIDLAYPTRRLYDHAAEGKPALRPDSPQPPRS